MCLRRHGSRDRTITEADAPPSRTERTEAGKKVDVKRHKVTFQLADGTTKTVKAGKKVDVAILKVGDSVSIQVGQGLLITADKP